MKGVSKESSMTVHLTCPECGSGIHIYPSQGSKKATCDICQNEVDLSFNADHEESILKDCPCCGRKDFYGQKDFNRKVGVVLFIIASILAIYTYGISLIVLWLFDMILFSKLGNIAICYNCQTIFRKVRNIKSIGPFNHEMNDRIVYSGHDFKGEQLEH